MAWLYISLLFLILFALMYIRYRNQDQDPLGDLDIPKKELSQIKTTQLESEKEEK